MNLLARISSIALIAFAAGMGICGCQSPKDTQDKSGDVQSSPSSGANPESAHTSVGLEQSGTKDPAPRAASPETKSPDTLPEVIDVELGMDNQTFRDRVVAHVRNTASGREASTCELALPLTTQWTVNVSAYRAGRRLHKQPATDSDLCTALTRATTALINALGPARGDLAQVRFRVDFPDRRYSLIEFGDTGLELDHGLIPVRTFDKAMLKQRIDQGKEYLFRVMDAEFKGAHKYYYTKDDRFEPRVHTIYTSSLLYTLLKLRAIDDDKRIDRYIAQGVEFIMSMQDLDKTGPGYGGFFYALETDKREPDRKLVVGTTSKTIFTLLWLADIYKSDKRYMQVATRAADWLLRMIKPDGSLKSYVRKKQDGKWVHTDKESILYTGQVLSALSRTFAATKNGKYLDGADLVAQRMVKLVHEQGCYVGDEYREPNPISSSWAVLALFDFFKVSGDKAAETVVFRCARELTTRQLRDRSDVYRHGRWKRAFSSSGNGWLAEVMSDLYLYCLEHKREGCDGYERSIIEVLRLLMQYTYSPENAFIVKQPAAAIGGVFWNVNERYVRTDSVCHAMNAYINMLPHLDDGPLLSFSEPPLEKRLTRKKRAPRLIDQQQPKANEP